MWAWQAKFLFAMDAGELGQIGKSIVRALEREPQLTRYFVLMPYDLPAGDTAKAGSAHTKWEEHVGTWTALAADKGMSVEFEYIGAHQLTKALTRPSQAGRLRYWFDIHAFDKPWFAGIAERAAMDAGPRYMPKLHVGLPIAETFASLGQAAEFELSLRDRLASLRSVGRFAWESPEKHRAVLTPLIEDVQPALIELDAALVSIIRGVGAGPEAVPGIGERLSLVRNLLEPLDEKFTELSPPQDGYYVGAAGSLYSSIRQVWRLLGDLRELSSGAIWHSAQRRLVVLTGEAGTGKTHLLCDVAKARTAAGLPTIILLGQHFDTRAPLVQMSELLHFGGAPDELLPTLNAAAQAAGHRGLVIIDALNEAGQPEMWQEHLAGLVHDVLQQPWLALAISCRTPYLDVVVPAAVREQGALVEHYGFEEATPEAVGRYLEFFGLETPSFPLLNPELANPLFLRLLCEALHSRGERRFPRKGVGLLWLYEAYLQAVDKRLSRPGRCDYDAQSRLAGQAVRKLAETQEDKGRAPTREEAAEIAETLLPGRRWSASLLKGLLDEGVVSTTHLAGTEYVQFGYQRLGDVATASLICDQPVEAAAAACRQLASQWGRHAGVLEALVAVLPETHGLDLVEVAGDALDGYARSQLSQAMLTGLSFRGQCGRRCRSHARWCSRHARHRPRCRDAAVERAGEHLPRGCAGRARPAAGMETPAAAATTRRVRGSSTGRRPRCPTLRTAPRRDGPGSCWSADR